MCFFSVVHSTSVWRPYSCTTGCTETIRYCKNCAYPDDLCQQEHNLNSNTIPQRENECYSYLTANSNVFAVQYHGDSCFFFTCRAKLTYLDSYTTYAKTNSCSSGTGIFYDTKVTVLSWIMECTCMLFTFENGVSLMR